MQNLVQCLLAVLAVALLQPEGPTHTVEACFRICLGTGRFEYDSAIPKLHSGNNHHYRRLSRQVS